MKTIFFLLAWLACTHSYCGSAETRERSQETFISNEKRLEVQSDYLRQIYPEVRSSIENALGWKLLSPPTVLLIGEKESFERMSGNPLISALALPERQLIVIHISPTTSEPYVLYETFQHELCHLLLHEHIQETLLPKWLDEGICQWVSGSFGEIVLGKEVSAGGIGLPGRFIALRQLTEDFPRDREPLLQAYEESRLFVDYLAAHYGREGILRLLAHLKAGQTIDQALFESFSQTLESLQGAWLEELQGTNEWLLWISRYLYEILFALGALLTVLAYVRLIIRKRSYDPAEDDEE